MGVGFLKANISSIVGQLYPQGDPRRDPGFTLYYYGINLGAFWASIICGLVGQTVELGRRLRPRRRRHAGRLPGLRAEQAAARGPRRAARPGRAGAPRGRADQSRVEHLPRRARRASAVVWWLVQQFALMGWLLGAGWIVALGYLGFEMSRVGKVGARAADAGAPAGRSARSIFFALVEQAGTSLNQFAERNTQLPQRRLLDRHAGADPVVQRRLHPDLRAGARLALGQARPAGPRPQPAGEVRPRPDPDRRRLLDPGLGRDATPTPASARRCSSWPSPTCCRPPASCSCSPVGLSEMTKLAPARMISTLMAIWFLGASGAQYARRPRSPSTTAAETVGGQVLDPGQGARHLRPHLPHHRRLGRGRRRRLPGAQPLAEALGARRGRHACDRRAGRRGAPAAGRAAHLTEWSGPSRRSCEPGSPAPGRTAGCGCRSS